MKIIKLDASQLDFVDVVENLNLHLDDEQQRTRTKQPASGLSFFSHSVSLLLLRARASMSERVALKKFSLALCIFNVKVFALILNYVQLLHDIKFFAFVLCVCM